MGVTSQKVAATQAVASEQVEPEQELTQHERERVIELMLSQERVISLLYDKTFQMTNPEQGSQLQDIEYSMKMQQELARRQQQQ